ncbi:MAG: rhomboid family intramembrane serine protease [Phycisphaerae bacterium]|nr:rhomboid family intramembrane serine protease [Phycisphaerae bacterium]
MFVFPYGADRIVRRTPLVNHALIGLNAGLYLVSKALEQARAGEWLDPYMLWPLDPTILQFFTYQFLHADLGHLAGNMVFLWVFGNNVNGRMGHVVYGLFYLACGVFAGVGFALAGREHPCVGASGAIAGVTTAYLVLFPRTGISVFYWIWLYIGTTSISALWFIVLKMILWDNLIAMKLPSGDTTNVAYSAHLVGYLAGFALSVLMLWLRALPRDAFDLLAIWRRAYQRASFASAMSDPNTRARAQYGSVAQTVAEDGRTIVPTARPADPASNLRDRVIYCLAHGEIDEALAHYARFAEINPANPLSRADQVEIANQFMARKQHAAAAEAYETYLRHYEAHDDAEQVKLLLGILYARYLERPDMASRYLRDCAERLSDPDQKAQARHWLQVAADALSGPTSAPAAPQA